MKLNINTCLILTALLANTQAQLKPTTPELETIPKDLVTNNSRLSFICHYSKDLNIKSIGLVQNYVEKLDINLESRNFTLLDKWKSRTDIEVASQSSFAVVTLITTSKDSGQFYCVTYFKDTNTRKVMSQTKNIIVGTLPGTPQLKLISVSGVNEWIPEHKKFTIECIGKDSHPSARIVVTVSGHDISNLGEISKIPETKSIKFTKEYEADPVLNGNEVACFFENEFGRSEVVNTQLVVRYTSHAVIISQDIDHNSPVKVNYEGGFLVCSAGGVPAPSINWEYVKGKPGGRSHFKTLSHLLEITAHAPVGNYVLRCNIKYATNSVTKREVKVRILQSSDNKDHFNPNVVAIIVGVFLAISALLNAIFVTLLYRIYSEDENWNASHKYMHIPIKKWVNNAVM